MPTYESAQAKLIVPPHDDIPALWLHDLTGTTQVEKLLDFPEQAIEEAKATLERLRILDSKTAKHFALKSSTPATLPFKLVSEINPCDGTDCENSASSTRHSFDSFIAVSYCWHSRDWQPADSCRFPEKWTAPISPHMLKTVLDLRSTKGEGIWIDQLCIDQDNPNEKVRVIHNMDAVYRSAGIVAIIWEDVALTPHEERVLDILSGKPEGTTAFRFLAPDSVERNFHLLSEDDVKRADDLVAKMYLSRWPGRAWCYHEFLLCQDNVILLPGVTGPNFALDPVFPDSLLKEVCDKYAKALPRWPTITMFAIHRGRGRDSITRSNFLLAGEVCTRSCSNREDKITIALNVTNLGLNFVGTVESEDKCRWAIASAVLCSGDATVLSARGVTPMFPSVNGNCSWLKWPDIFYVSPSCQALSQPRISMDLGISSYDFHSLTWDMLQLHFPPKNPSELSIRMATSFIRYCESSLPKVLSTMNGYWQLKKLSDGSVVAEPAADERRVVIRYLACGLDNGIRWMAGAFSQIGCEDNLQLCFPFLDLAEQLLPAAIDHLFTDEVQRHLNPQVEQGLQKFLEVAIDPGYYMVNSGNPFIISLGSEDDKAIIRCPYILDTLDSITLAVPVALANASCSGVERVWHLRKSNDRHGHEWVIVDKSAISGCGEIKCNGKGVSLLQNVRIVGRSGLY